MNIKYNLDNGKLSAAVENYKILLNGINGQVKS